MIGLGHVNDRVIRQYAIDNGYIITTRDADFYEMSLIHGQPPKIVWLKMGNPSKTATIKTLPDNQQTIQLKKIPQDKSQSGISVLPLRLHLKYPPFCNSQKHPDIENTIPTFLLS